MGEAPPVEAEVQPRPLDLTPVDRRMSQAIVPPSPPTGFGVAAAAVDPFDYMRAQPPLPLDQPRKRSHIERWFMLLAFMLFGYALFGRGFAYIGVPPLFIGEIGLLLGAFIFCINKGTTQAFDLKQTPFLILIMTWGALRTFPFIPKYGFDALRDGVMWAYMSYAIIVAGLLLVEPRRLSRLFWQYRTFALGILILMPMLLVLKSVGKGLMPDVPGTSVGIFSPRRGNTLSHMAVICSFIIAGFAHRRTAFFAVFTVPFLLVTGDANRAGILTFTVAVGMATVLSRINKKAVNLWGSMVAMILVVAAIGINLQIRDNPVDPEKLADKVLGIVGLSNNSRYTNSADWRLNWWKDIINYTVNGQYFWTGKGFGINLADDDGYQVEAQDALRHPHSIHFNWLARTGVPGLTMWMLLHMAWGFPIFYRYLECRRRGDPRWSGVFLVLLTYWTAELCNASFDVDLEGPMGGIWFWTVYGTGMAALVIHRRWPEIMYQDADWDRHEMEQQKPRKRSAYYRQLAAYNWTRRPALPEPTAEGSS
jgi:hypothetical protein